MLVLIETLYGINTATVIQNGKKNKARGGDGNVKTRYKFTCLILVQLAVLVLLFALLLECDDDKTDENVDHEERDDDDVNEVEDGDRLSVVVYRAQTLAVRVDTRVHQTEKHERSFTQSSHNLKSMR